jgi:hypothetical protein
MEFFRSYIPAWKRSKSTIVNGTQIRKSTQASIIIKTIADYDQSRITSPDILVVLLFSPHIPRSSCAGASVDYGLDFFY